MKILYLLYESLKGKIEDSYKFSHRFSCPDHKNCENCRPKCISGMGVRGVGVGSTICKYWNKFGGCSSSTMAVVTIRPPKKRRIQEALTKSKSKILISTTTCCTASQHEAL